MKQLLPQLLLILIFHFDLSAQHLDTYPFDNYIDATDNDLKNNFTNISNFYQTSSGGVPDGCVNINNSLSNATAKSKISFIFRVNDTLKFDCQIYFRGDTISVDNAYPAFGFRMHPYSTSMSAFDFSKYIEYFIDKPLPSNNDAIGVADHDSASHSYIGPLFLAESWYRFEIKAYKNPALSNITSAGNLYKLSADGQTNLGLVTSFTNDYITNADIYNTELYTFSLKGRYYEGVKKIDNINISSGSFPTISEPYKTDMLAPSLVNTIVDDILYINRYNHSNINLSMYNLFGQKIYTQKLCDHYISLGALPAGQYICSLESGNITTHYRVVKK